MGIACTALIEVEPKFWMREVREMRPWKQVKADLQAGRVFEENEHWEIVFSPYRHRGDVQCLVTTRNRLTEPLRDVSIFHRMRSVVVEASAKNPKTPKLLNHVLRAWPRLAPLLLQTAMRSLVLKEYVEVSHKVFNIGSANLVPAWSGEVAIPMDGRHIEAVERVCEVAEEMRRDRKIYQSSPIALRFVKASPAQPVDDARRRRR